MKWKTTIVSAIISIIISAISGWFSAKQSYAKEIQKSVYEKREELYIKMFELIELLHKSPIIQYNTKKLIKPLRRLNAKANLYASREVLKIFTPFYERVLEEWDKYTDLYDSEKAERELSNRKVQAVEDNESVEQIEHEFNQEAESYMENHLLTEAEITDALKKLATQIRLELKTE